MCLSHFQSTMQISTCCDDRSGKMRACGPRNTMSSRCTSLILMDLSQCWCWDTYCVRTPCLIGRNAENKWMFFIVSFQGGLVFVLCQTAAWGGKNPLILFPTRHVMETFYAGLHLSTPIQAAEYWWHIFSRYEVESICAICYWADGGKSRWRSMSTCIFFKVRGHAITLCVFHNLYDGRQRGGLFVTDSLQNFNIPFCSLSVPSLFYIQNVALIMPRVVILICVDGKQTSYGSGITTLLLQPTFTFLIIFFAQNDCMCVHFWLR